MKILRRLAMVLLVLGIVLVGSAIYLHHQARAVPTWYRHLKLDNATQHVASNNMLQKLAATYGAANDAMAAATRAKFPMPPAQPTELPPTPITLELSEAEINSCFAEWDTQKHWRQRISKYVEDPVVILEDHELIIAGTVTDWNMVASLHFAPRLENGKLDFGLKQVMVGTLPLPRSAVESYIAKVEGAVDKKLPELRERADIGPKGWANSDAVAAAMGELLLHSLHDEPAEPVLMLHEMEKKGPDARSLPVLITGIDISNKTLTLKLRTMTPDEREALGTRLRGADTPQVSSNSN